ncbi:MAG: CHC2 zinc finger domain-containing protein [Thermodesulfobacteriota bacterium]|jgi:hypothetical protein
MIREVDEICERLLARGYALTLFGDLEKRRKSGRGYTALCPFHKEKTPSFGKSIFEYGPDSHGAEDYLALCRESSTDNP